MSTERTGRTAYQKFLRLGIGLAPLGVARGGEGDCAYFCTPKGASILGWAGVDGIHYCFVRGFGETVFAVSPMNAAPEYVHPVAGNFTDFLRLLLACGGADALEQAWQWDEARFGAFLSENPPGPEQEAVLSAIREKTGLTPMEQPWRYIKELQTSFDSSRLRYTEDFYDPDMNPDAPRTAPPWRVTFEGGFWGGGARERAGAEIPVNTHFEWAGHQWTIPSLYVCGKGLVADFCMRVETSQIEAFMEKWGFDRGGGPEPEFSREQRMELETENPLVLHFSARIELNGRTLRARHGSGICYNPVRPDGAANEPGKWALEHYGLDPSYGWMLWRGSFPWATARRPVLKAPRLTLEQDPVPLPGPCFRVSAPGDTFSLPDPDGGTVYTLRVLEYERQTLPDNTRRALSANMWPDDGLEYPTHYHAMRYTVEPEPPDFLISVQDCAPGDPARRKPSASGESGPAAASIGIIGGADGPTVLLLAHGKKPRAAASALRFEPVETVEWRAVFHKRHFAPLTLDINL